MSRKAPGFTLSIRSTSSSGSARWLFTWAAKQLILCCFVGCFTLSDAAGRRRRPEKRYIGTANRIPVRLFTAGRLVGAEFPEVIAVSCEFRF